MNPGEIKPKLGAKLLPKLAAAGFGSEDDFDGVPVSSGAANTVDTLSCAGYLKRLV
jgi:hypothetical protein